MATEDRMITPFVPEQITDGVISYGLGSYGYDMRLAPEFQVCGYVYEDDFVDPKRDKPFMRRTIVQNFVDVPPNGFVLGYSIEWFRLPYNVLGHYYGKSTYMRCGLVFSAGLVQPGFHGQIVVELANATPFPIRVYANEGIATLVFHENEDCDHQYVGQFYGQNGIRLPNQSDTDWKNWRYQE